MSSISIYEQIGGSKALDGVLKIFYDKMLRDERVNYFFKDSDMKKVIARQKVTITFACGGSQVYTARPLREAHKQMVEEGGLNDTHFDITLKHMEESLREYGIEDSLIETVITVLDSTRNEVLNKQPHYVNLHNSSKICFIDEQ